MNTSFPLTKRTTNSRLRMEGEYFLISFSPSSGIGFYEFKNNIYRFDLIAEENFIIQEPELHTLCLEFDQVEAEIYFGLFKDLMLFVKKEYLHDKKNTYYAALFMHKLSEDLRYQTLQILNHEDFRNISISESLIPIFKEVANPKLVFSTIQDAYNMQFMNVKECLAKELQEITFSEPVISLHASNSFLDNPKKAENMLILLADYISMIGIVPEFAFKTFKSLFNIVERNVDVLGPQAFDATERLMAYAEYESPSILRCTHHHMKFTRIDAGEFMMGSPEGEEGRHGYEGPAHEVTIYNPFALGTYPVTQREWEAVMVGNPSRFKGDELPVEDVSWNDVQEFIRRLNDHEGTHKYRLPSEAEWEYACRAGTNTLYFFGNDESMLGEYAWYADNSDDKMHPVGQKKPNPWGLYDMHGNVWEWVQDKWHDNYDGVPTDGSAWESGGGSRRVFRGGSWSSSARICRSAYRYNGAPGSRVESVGFRLLREL